MTARLALPRAAMLPRYDAVVVGSGYGGAIAACRLARAGRSVAVLERGRELVPGEFPASGPELLREVQTDTPLGRAGRADALFDVRRGADVSVLLGCGLGGGSLINANVALRPEPRVLADPSWPSALREDAEGLERGFERAEAMLRPTPYPEAGARLPKLEALEAAGTVAGGRFSRPPLTVAWTEGQSPAGVMQQACTLCGDCTSGCNHGAKSTLLVNYLPDAASHGAELFTGVEARRVERCAGGWLVHYRPAGGDGFGGPDETVAADVVVLGAGTLGSTEILLRSRETGLPLSDRVGHGFTANGDVIAFAYNADRAVDGVGWGAERRDPVGPTITGVLDLRGKPELDEGIVIQDGAIPGALAAALPAVLGSLAALGDDRDGDEAAEARRALASLTHGPYAGAVRHTLTFLVMAHDDAAGRIVLAGDRARVEWPGAGRHPTYARVDERLARAAEAIGATFVRSPLWSRLAGHDVVSVHPLGGCASADDGGAGVVDHRGLVFTGAGEEVHRGLYVCDGSVVPRSLGVNPLLTISALAERAAALLVGEAGAAAPGPRAPRRVAVPATRIRFAERMAGGVISPSGTRSRLSFVATVEVDPGDGAGTIAGTAESEALSDRPLTIRDGRFRLFAETGPGAREMRYRMTLVAHDGRSFELEGIKGVRDHRGLDLWRDTTSLAVSVSAAGAAVADGVLRIRPADLVRQLRTMRVEGPGAASAIARFGRLWAGTLWDVYGGLADEEDACSSS